MKYKKLERREWLRRTGLASLGFLVAGRANGEKGKSCSRTPEQISGPFTPKLARQDEDNDLTSIKGRPGRASGEIIVLRGKVVDSKCGPVSGAVVQIWQACATGRYDHPQDDNPAPLDPNFQYWGTHAADDAGRFWFKTIMPGPYPGRTPHIHLRVSAKGRRTLTTQIYFKGEPGNARDGIYNLLSQAQKELVTVELKTHVGELHKTGELRIVFG